MRNDPPEAPRRTWWLAAGLFGAVLVIAAGLAAAPRPAPPVAGEPAGAGAIPAGGDAMPIRLLFIHHSCGGQLLAAPGPRRGGEAATGDRCIYESHPNGGDLRRRLREGGYEVHEASYGSVVGEDTDVHHWRRKFAGQMERILTTDRQDRVYEDGRRNEIVVFKSCFPNNRFVGAGKEPGDPDDPELTVANAKAAYGSLLPLLRARPEVLFVAVTAPPLAEPRPEGALAKLTRPFRSPDPSAGWAREFNAWLADREAGWLAGYDLPNVAVFDYYGILTGRSDTGWSAYPTAGGRDSHPSRQGNELAADAFVPFLDAAVARLWPDRRPAASTR